MLKELNMNFKEKLLPKRDPDTPLFMVLVVGTFVTALLMCLLSLVVMAIVDFGWKLFYLIPISYIIYVVGVNIDKFIRGKE